MQDWKKFTLKTYKYNVALLKMLSPLVSIATAILITCPCLQFWKNNRA